MQERKGVITEAMSLRSDGFKYSCNSWFRDENTPTSGGVMVGLEIRTHLLQEG